MKVFLKNLVEKNVFYAVFTIYCKPHSCNKVAHNNGRSTMYTDAASASSFQYYL